jgi:hypothetical protein
VNFASDCCLRNQFLVSPEYYSCNIPSLDTNAEISTEIILADGYRFPNGRNAIQVINRGGYTQDEMPESIKTAAVELDAWSLKRMRGGQLGAEGLIGTNKGRTQAVFEKRMPPHVQELFTPFNHVRTP